MPDQPNPTLEEVLALFDMLAAQDQVNFINQILVKPIKASFGGRDLPNLLAVTQALLGLESLGEARRKLLETDAAIEVVQKLQNANMARMAKTTKEALALTDGLLTEKERRDRKSNPETVRRNIKICDRRKDNKKRWTLGALAREYGISRSVITRILKQEEKWRSLLPSK